MPGFTSPGGREGRKARPAPSGTGGGSRPTRSGPKAASRSWCAPGAASFRCGWPIQLTRAAEQAFLYALSATANVRLSAAAAGASARAFYRRRRLDPVFAREFRLALKMGWERLEMESLRAASPFSHARDRWRNCPEAPIPKLSWDQAFQLLCLHEKSVCQGWEQAHRRRRRGESDEIYRLRLQSMWRAEKDVEAEAEALRRAARYEETGSWRHADEPPPPPLPPLETVTGWSRADPAKTKHNPGLALFGGWRIAEMERKLARG